MSNKEHDAFVLAQDIERLADMLDPYGYMDYVQEYHDGDIDKSIKSLYNDIMSGNIKYILDWLLEQAIDPYNSERDQERALNRFCRLIEL